MKTLKESNHAAQESPRVEPGSSRLGRPWRLIVRGFRERIRRYFPELRVWGPLVARVVAIGALLTGVAWLGERDSDETTYGVRLNVEAERAGPDLTQPSQVEAITAVQTAPAAAQRVKQEPESPEKPSTAAADPCQEEGEARPKGITSDGRVILNESSAEELTTLKGVGDKRASDIVNLRKRLGGFRKVADLLRIRGIGWKTLRRLKDQVVLDRPPPKRKKEEETKSAEESS